MLGDLKMLEEFERIRKDFTEYYNSLKTKDSETEESEDKETEEETDD